MSTMAATEVEDLAALVGIEILPDNVSEEGTETHHSKTTFQVHDDDDASESQSEDPNTQESPSEALPSSKEGDDLTDKLAALEEEFSHRYTSEDQEFKQTLSTPTHPPPCVAPWWSNNRGQDRSRGDRGGGWGRGRDRGRGHQYDNRRRDDSHSRSQGQSHSYHRHDDRSHDNRRDHYRDREPHGGHRDRSPRAR